MSQTAPLEVCALCDTFHPTSELEDVPFLDAKRNVITLRICRSCMHPHVTYVQAGRGFNEADVLIVTLAIVLIAVGVLFGMIAGHAVGVAVLVACSLVGAGILAAEAASKCT
jgi:hypothetical protein